jgi:hypothetical protein
VFGEVVPGSNGRDDLVQDVVVLRENVSALVPLKLSRERMVSKHVADPSCEVAAAQVRIRLPYIDPFELRDEFAERMSANAHGAAVCEDERMTIGHPTSDISCASAHFTRDLQPGDFKNHSVIIARVLLCPVEHPIWNGWLCTTAKPAPEVAHRACLWRPAIVTDEIARRSPLLFRQKNETLKSFEDLREAGASMSIVRCS